MMQLLNMDSKEIVPDAVGPYGLPIYIQILQGFQYLQHDLTGMGLRLHWGKRTCKHKSFCEFFCIKKPSVPSLYWVVLNIHTCHSWVYTT